MQINPLIAATAASVLVLSVVGVNTIIESRALHPEQTSVAFAATAKPILKPCRECGVVMDIREIDGKAAGTGVVAVVSGFVGAVFGHEASGDKNVGTMASAGAKRYEIQVRMSDGNVKTLTSSTQPIWKAGDRVRLQNGKLAG